MKIFRELNEAAHQAGFPNFDAEGLAAGHLAGPASTDRPSVPVWEYLVYVATHPEVSIEEISRRSVQRVADIDVPTASAEDTIIAKLEWAKEGSSERQLTDVAGILRLRGESLDRPYLERWIDALELRAQWERALGLR